MSALALRSEPTGLYGWIQSNDARSLKLFGGFALSIQLMVAALLIIPLAAFDPEHSPLLGPVGYVLRYVPIILGLSVAVFAVKLYWYMETVRAAAGFVFVDDKDEPRLCRIIEPLIIANGIPVPFVATIDTSSLNAFACGISRKRSVVVVTRGLLEALTDAELEAVLAHELAHIKNGDIRLMAAVSICMRFARKFKTRDEFKFNPVAGMLCVVVPALFVVILLGAFAAQLGIRGAFASRLAITSSREFMADAEAVEMTKNPAALASALLKIDGSYLIESVRREDDAMMIAGESKGKNASHPEVNERIEALARVTGSMVFNAPGAAPLAALGNAERGAALDRRHRMGVMQRVRTAVPGGLLGFARWSYVWMAATVAIFLYVNSAHLNNPRVMAAQFDVRTITIGMGLDGDACLLRPKRQREACFAAREKTLESLKNQPNLAGMAARMSLDETQGTLKPYAGQSGKMKGVMIAMRSNGAFPLATPWSHPADAATITELEHVGCFHSDMFYGEPSGHYALDGGDGDVRLDRYLGYAEASLITRGPPGSEAWRQWLKDYVQTRELMTKVAYDFYGLPGLRKMTEAYDTRAHKDVLAQLRQAQADPTFTRGMNPVARAELSALVRGPKAFVPCLAVRHGYEA